MGSESEGKKLGVNSVTGVCHCFRCDYSAGSVSRLLADLNGGYLSMEDSAALAGDDTVIAPAKRKMVAEAYRLLNESLNQTPDSKPLQIEVFPHGSIPLYTGEGLTRTSPRTYMMGRGYTAIEVERLIRFYKLLYLPVGARDVKRRRHIIIPVMIGGRPVWWTTRAAYDAERKSQNPFQQEGFISKENCLLGFDQSWGRGSVVVTEGPFSMFAFQTLPKPQRRRYGAVCLMGTTVSGFQLDLFRALASGGAKRFVVATEPDKAEFRDKLSRLLSEILPTYILPLNAGDGDPDDEKRRLFWLLRRVKRYSRLTSVEIMLRSALTTRQK